MIQTFLLAVAGFNFLIPMITSLVKTTPFSLEDMDSTSDPITMRISGLLAILRSHKETIFEREEGISKYETLEQIRQQTLGGPFLQQQLVRDVTFTALLLISPLFLIGFLSPEITVSPFLRYCYSLILLLTLIFSVSLAMREMLEERSTLRLDSIRVTLLPIQEITRVKEWVANILPYTVTKWCLSFALIFSLLEKGSVATLVVFAFLAFQTWLALSIAAGLGLRLGLSARDELEGSLWIALLFLFWILLPYLGVKLLVFESLGETSRLFLHSLAGISPLYLIHWLVPKAIAADEWSYIFGGLAMQWLLWFGLGYFNRRRIGLAW